MRPSVLALAVPFAASLACASQPAPAPPPVFVPVAVPQSTPTPTATTSPTTPSKPSTPKPPKPPPEPIPPAPAGAKPDLLARDLDLVGDTVTFDLVNRGGESLTGFGFEVVLAGHNGEGRTITVDQEIPGGLSATTSVTQRVRMPGLDAKFPHLATDGGEMDVRVTVDVAGQVDESDETNNAAAATLRIEATAAPEPVPVIQPNPTPIPPPATPAPPPAAPTTAAITFRRSDDAWANVWVDGNKVFEPKNFEKEKKITLSQGPHRIKVEDFMGNTTWSEGTLTVTGGQDMVVGFSEGHPFDVYNAPDAFKPL